MGSAQETAEAILLVIKRLLKWVGILAVSLVAIIAAVVGFLNHLDDREHKRNQEESDKIEVVAIAQENECDKDYPYLYGIVNKSDKTVTNVRFTVEVRKKGFSAPLNSYTSIDEDKILKPGEGYGRCFRATKKDYSGEIKDKDVDIVITSKNVTFLE